MIESTQNLAENMQDAAKALLQLRVNPNSAKAMKALEKAPKETKPSVAKKIPGSKLKVRVAGKEKGWSLNGSVGNQSGGCTESTIQEVAKLLKFAALEGALAIIATSKNVALLERPNGKTVETLSLNDVLNPQAYTELLQTAATLGTLVFELS